MNIEGTYVAIEVGTDQLETVVDRVRRGELDGINVTMPHKKAVAGLVDELTADAGDSHSVNTIVRHRDGRLVGHSTDISALRRLWGASQVPADRPALVLGAGGAAAAACLAAPATTLYVSARRPEAVAALAETIDRRIVGVGWQVAVADAIVVNATTLGMNGEDLPARVVRLASGLMDLTYGRETTPAVAMARAKGLPTVDGRQVLVAQAGDSFRLWTGHEPPWKTMEEAARNPSRLPDG